MNRFKVLLLALLSGLCALAQTEDDVMFSIIGGLDDNPTLKTVMEQNLSNFLTACNTAIRKDANPRFKAGILSDDAVKSFREMWKSSSMSCASYTIEGVCLRRQSGGYQVRNVPIMMWDFDENEQSQELVFNFTRNGQIDDISLALEEHRWMGIMTSEGEENAVDLFRREVIVDFVENYRTAYNRKDLQFISDVFSDNALIITGRVIKQKPQSDRMMQSLGTQVVYQQHNKKEYIAHLKSAFARKKYINCVFSDVEVHQHPKYDDIYGVTLKQNWTDSNYHDVGYVFLLIDFQDKDQPMIQVRTWQPEDGMKSADEVFGLHSFPNILK